MASDDGGSPKASPAAPKRSDLFLDEPMIAGVQDGDSDERRLAPNGDE